MRAERINTAKSIPVKVPADISHPIATNGNGLDTVTAVKIIPSDWDDRAILGDNWLIRQFDPARNIYRESTDLYASADQAYDAYWTGEVEWEAWVSELFVTAEAA
jgi:hypothetical protein